MDVRLKADGCLQRYLWTSLQTLTDVNKCSDGRQYEGLWTSIEVLMDVRLIAGRCPQR